MTQPQSATTSGKAYTAPGITVYYDAVRCRHVAACVRGLPNVFDPQARPWIQPANAEAGAVAAVVRTCPTGALHYVLEGGPAETPDPATTIAPLPNGPLIVRGDLTLMTAGGPVREVRAALCRCGASTHKPYCDGTHDKIGWRSEPEAEGTTTTSAG
ncbi:(4Fe-4S)-binding protein [Deinococcus puniceus]|uniref:Iron-binding zinc finger CDGSH type domain-containing protein n=1 Tax=Deinococcus puniceus TaxID=1182568 RepID=A0A172T7F9_9DEIO|nr:(4Fe-4S)-binding protein [Deinococcus puniceus]ANE42866.1 hypothetical protein SU48_02780 [Deinococcus puniceus]